MHYFRGSNQQFFAKKKSFLKLLAHKKFVGPPSPPAVLSILEQWCTGVQVSTEGGNLQAERGRPSQTSEPNRPNFQAPI